MKRLAAKPINEPNHRRRFLSAGAACLLATATDLAFAQETELRAQRLAWAGVKLELPSAAIFIDLLANAEVWGGSLKHLLIPLHYGVSGDRGYVEIPQAEEAFVTLARQQKLPVEIAAPGAWLKWQANR